MAELTETHSLWIVALVAIVGIVAIVLSIPTMPGQSASMPTQVVPTDTLAGEATTAPVCKQKSWEWYDTIGGQQCYRLSCDGKQYGPVWCTN